MEFKTVQGLVKMTNGFYKVRFRIPENLSPFMDNRQEVSKSLYTKQLRTAKAKAGVLLSKYKEIVEYSRFSIADNNALAELCKCYLKDTLRLHRGCLAEVKGELKSHKPDNIKISYKRLFTEFCIYYNQKPTGKCESIINKKIRM